MKVMTGSELRRIRKRLGLTQAGFAKEMGWRSWITDHPTSIKDTSPAPTRNRFLDFIDEGFESYSDKTNGSNNSNET